jgi:CDP-diacylglycerol---glycerol-3-phosphate 3-phosphatidyltransferase
MNWAIVLTASRIFIAPVFAWFFIGGYKTGEPGAWIWISIALAGLIEMTDLFDGRVARARGQVTDMGKVFDPIADSVSRQTVFLSFMVTGIIPWWLYLVFFYRDAFMQLLRIICASSGVVLAARKSGKAKAVLQGIAAFGVLFVVLLLTYDITWIPERIGPFHTGFYVILLPAIYTALSVIDYVVPNRALIMKMMEPKR